MINLFNIASPPGLLCHLPHVFHCVISLEMKSEIPAHCGYSRFLITQMKRNCLYISLLGGRQLRYFQNLNLRYFIKGHKL